MSTADELQALSRRNSVSGASASLRQKLERIFSREDQDPSAPHASGTPPPPRPPAPPPPPPPGCSDDIPKINAAQQACAQAQPECCDDTTAAVDALVHHNCTEYCMFLKNAAFHPNMKKCAVAWPTDMCGPEPPSRASA